MDVSAVEDPVQRRALETMIKTYGQTPRQLFQSAHASRPGSKLNIEGELPAAVGLLVQFAFRETREQVKEITYPVCHLDFNRIQENTAQLLRRQAFSQALEAQGIEYHGPSLKVCTSQWIRMPAPLVLCVEDAVLEIWRECSGSSGQIVASLRVITGESLTRQWHNRRRKREGRNQCKHA